MADIDEAFASLEQLDEQARTAVTLAGSLWAEMYCDAVARAERAEYLLEPSTCLPGYATGRQAGASLSTSRGRRPTLMRSRMGDPQAFYPATAHCFPNEARKPVS